MGQSFSSIVRPLRLAVCFLEFLHAKSNSQSDALNIPLDIGVELFVQAFTEKRNFPHSAQQ